VETRRRTLEEISEIFSSKHPVKHSLNKTRIIMHGNGRGVTEMLDKDEMVIERDFGGDIDDGRGNRHSGSSGEAVGRGKERDSAGSEGRLVGGYKVRDSAGSEGMAGNYEMTGWGNSGARFGST
jgi:hypothetical protein